MKNETFKFKMEANKSLGQHFLKTKSVIDKICTLPIGDADKEKIDFILEVGPGPGVLTVPLKEHGIPLYVIEKDSRTKEYLEELLGVDHVYMGDATKLNFHDWLQERKLNSKAGWLVSNLPYNVSTVLLRLFLECKEFQNMTLMFQREVGEKLLPSYVKNNSLKALVTNFYEISLVDIVKPGAFHPPPKVDSIIIKLKRRPHPKVGIDEILEFEKFNRELFQNPRKQIFSKLKNLFKESNPLMTAMSELQLSPQDRAETLKMDQIVELYQAYKIGR
ncbi:MAG: 16S rRNA (adenine(1518)-N(6)/adenine(1519)-N(6))-dimethyltransferase RsmA [Bacteriovoracaceae bacterium]|nr:16S rRNA (adenine(1518)-N(6)/adenine(1519)-N(6))-dimethyltransferase RsmA [Bacteriovoracaceae bacterium]